jgi:thiamine-phosphate pyrophosphorylase
MLKYKQTPKRQTLEKANTTLTSAIELPALYPIVSFGSASAASKQQKHAFKLAQVLLGLDAALFQIRYKGPEKSELKEFASAVLQVKKELGSSSKIIINDDVELCRELLADGVHLGQEDASTEYARDLLGEAAIIGISTHTIAQVKTAQNSAANYLGFGPIFQSESKSGHADLCGCEKLLEATRLSHKPIVAIGGISRAEIDDIFSGGAQSAAVISDLHRDPLSNESISKLIKLYATAKAKKKP